MFQFKLVNRGGGNISVLEYQTWRKEGKTFDFTAEEEESLLGSGNKTVPNMSLSSSANAQVNMTPSSIRAPWTIVQSMKIWILFLAGSFRQKPQSFSERIPRRCRDWTFHGLWIRLQVKSITTNKSELHYHFFAWSMSFSISQFKIAFIIGLSNYLM